MAQILIWAEEKHFFNILMEGASKATVFPLLSPSSSAASLRMDSSGGGCWDADGLSPKSRGPPPSGLCCAPTNGWRGSPAAPRPRERSAGGIPAEAQRPEVTHLTCPPTVVCAAASRPRAFGLSSNFERSRPERRVSRETGTFGRGSCCHCRRCLCFCNCAPVCVLASPPARGCYGRMGCRGTWLKICYFCIIKIILPLLWWQRASDSGRESAGCELNH